MLSADGQALKQEGLFRSDSVQSLPLGLLSMARQAYLSALRDLLVRAVGAPARLVFRHGQDRYGYQVCLLPSKSLDSLALARVGQNLDQTIRIVQQSEQVLWLMARTMGVSREMFDLDYTRAQQALADTPVTGWDVVRYLSLGGGVRRVTTTEGHLSIEVTQHGLTWIDTPIAEHNSDDSLDDDHQEPDLPRHH